MGKFGFNELLNTKSKTSGTVSVEDFKEIWLSPYEVKPSESNFYSQENIEELADSFLAVGQQQPVILGRINDEFRIVSGHRRNRALILNIERGYKEFEKARYLYRDMTETMFELSLLIGNAYNRELTPWEKTQQAQKLKEALQKAKQEDGLRIQGKLRDTIADIMNESSSNVARMDLINRSAVPEIKEQFAEGRMGISAAYEAAKLLPEQQKRIAEDVASGKSVQAKEIGQKEKVTEEKVGGERKTDALQGKIIQEWLEGGSYSLPESVKEALKKVSESDTFRSDWSLTEQTIFITRTIMRHADHMGEQELEMLKDIMIRVEQPEENGHPD